MSTDQKTHDGVLREDSSHCNSANCWCWDDRYQVVTRHDTEELALAVNAFIHQKGWVPLGGVSRSVNDSGNVLWAQAMVRHV